MSIIEPGKRPVYMAWGHPDGNNCTKRDAIRALKRLYQHYRIGAHNGKFDLEVGEAHCDLPLVPKHGWEDSMLLAFLHNPRELNLKLKPLADKYLNLKPVEQTRLDNWILAHIFTSQKGGDGKIVIANEKPNGYFKVPPTKTGRFIAYAPVPLVTKYANGDTLRTDKLIKKFYKIIKEKKMLDQYDIEKRVVIKAIEMEREGVNIDYKALAPDLEKAKKVLKRAEKAIQKKLGNINLNSGPQKIAAFEEKGLVDEWEYTEKGNPKTGIDSLMLVCTDKQLVKDLDTFSKYTKLIGTYMQPWLDSALANNGKFYPWFNTIKGDNDKGTYTGRFSSNFQQVPRKPKDKKLPFLRNYIIADKPSHTLFNRDFSSQEIRILAHFEDGQLLSAYLADPTLDVHDFVREEMEALAGRTYDRSDHVKPCNFLIVYGGGAPALSKNIGVPFEEAKSLIKIHGEALPGVGELKDDLRLMARRGEEFKTAGGRWYDFEENFEYVALNTLIQGSAADHTKRALLAIDDMIKTKGYDARIMLTVHDEFMLSGSRKMRKRIMADFKKAMEYDELFDLPMLSDGKIGLSWGKMQKCS